MNKIYRTWSLMSACWQILKKDKEMLLFPLISGLCCLLLLASFVLPFYLTGSWQPPKAGAETGHHVMYYGMTFLFYVCSYFVVVFFNCAVVACATIRMSGGDPSVADGIRAAASRLPAIFGWALILATVGLIVRIIEDRSKKVGQLVAGLFGMAWTLVSFLVIPILVVENKGPLKALSESTQLLKKTWGEQLVGNFSFGLIFFLLGIPDWPVHRRRGDLPYRAGAGAVGVAGDLSGGTVFLRAQRTGAGGVPGGVSARGDGAEISAWRASSTKAALLSDVRADVSFHEAIPHQRA
ncbi:MAG: hypothetical protein E6L09_04450 [Verrucomicrobia bacterium]|nr:MAG: hypothetical protein E6L09_04450 [Verrucomicrobiota bacterium]